MSDEVSTSSTDENGATEEVDTSDIADLSYEEARDELVAIVAKLEGSSASLEESMSLWARGEKLAEHCQQWLNSAEKKLDESEAAEA